MPRLAYADRIKSCSMRHSHAWPSAFQKHALACAANQSAKLMLEVMERKRSNLCVAVDVTTTAELIKLADAVGPYICLLKERAG